MCDVPVVTVYFLVFELFTWSGIHGVKAWLESTASWMEEKTQDFVTLSLKKPPVCRLSSTPAARKKRKRHNNEQGGRRRARVGVGVQQMISVRPKTETESEGRHEIFQAMDERIGSLLGRKECTKSSFPGHSDLRARQRSKS